MKITVLTDNTPHGELAGEWGFSVHIEYKGKNYLLDFGETGLFAVNAEKLGVDLSQVDYAFLSHAHSDHSNGMASFFERNEKAKLFLQTCCGENCYMLKEQEEPEYIGIGRGLLGRFEDRLERVSGKTSIENGVWLLAHDTPGLEQVGADAKMLLQTEKGMENERFAHEQSLIFESGKGLIVFNSCSHAGGDVIMNEALEAFPGQPIYAYIGGLHLLRSSREVSRTMGERMKALGLEHLITGHCTGEEALEELKAVLGDKLQVLYAGLELEL